MGIFNDDNVDGTHSLADEGETIRCVALGLQCGHGSRFIVIGEMGSTAGKMCTRPDARGTHRALCNARANLKYSLDANCVRCLAVGSCLPVSSALFSPSPTTATRFLRRSSSWVTALLQVSIDSARDESTSDSTISKDWELLYCLEVEISV